MKMAIIPCRQATLLICKKQERALTLRERFKLRAHLKVCEFCRRFLAQTEAISRAVRTMVAAESLMGEEKKRMEAALEGFMKS